MASLTCQCKEAKLNLNWYIYIRDFVTFWEKWIKFKVIWTKVNDDKEKPLWFFIIIILLWLKAYVIQK